MRDNTHVMISFTVGVGNDVNAVSITSVVVKEELNFDLYADTVCGFI